MAEHANTDGPGWHLVVDPSSDGMRLDRFIASRLPRVSRARASRLQVTNLQDPSQVMKKSSAVRDGQAFWVHRPNPDADVSYPDPVVLEDTADYLVLDKPPGLAVHPSASRFTGTVTHWLSSIETYADVKPAHRLDVETSGVLICTRPPSEYEIGRLFAERRVTKTYLAVVEGIPEEDEWTVDTPLGFDEHSGIRVKMGPGDLPAKTHFQVRRRGLRRTLLEARPITGRQHQIRVHLQMSGFPITGDKLYGGDDTLFLASRTRALTTDELNQLGHARQALHAWTIELPLGSGVLRSCAELPEDLNELLK